MVINVEFVLSMFVLFYFLILFYDLVTLYKNKNSKKLDEKFRNELIELIFEYENATDKEESHELVHELIKKLKKMSYLSVLGQILEDNCDIGNEKVRDIITNGNYVSVFLRLTEFYSKKEPLVKAYYAYILQFVNIEKEEIYDFLYQCILTPSIYCVENALLTLYKLGNIDSIIHAYFLISRENIYYNNKLIADGLSNFSGSQKELCNKLYESFEKFNDESKVGLLRYFRNCKYNLSKEILNDLNRKDLDKEVEIAMIRYFTKVKSKKASEVFVNRLNENYYNDFEYDVVLIQALENNSSPSVITALEKASKSSNYYVRYNACKALKKLTDLEKIKNITDPYQKDMLDYFKSQGV